MFGGLPEMTQDQLKRIIFYVRELLKQAFVEGVPSLLPKYPGLEKVLGDGADGLNILHLIALYTKPHPELAKGFISAAQSVGLWTKDLLRVGLKSNGAIPLHVAAEANNRLVVEQLLIRDDSQVEIRNEEGLLASEIAQAAGNSSMAAYLNDEEIKFKTKKSLFSARDHVSVFGSSDSSSSLIITSPTESEGGEKKILSGAFGVMQILTNMECVSGPSSGDSETTTPESRLTDSHKMLIEENSETSANLEILTNLLRTTSGMVGQVEHPRDPRQRSTEEDAKMGSVQERRTN